MSNLLNRAIPVATIALTLLACTRSSETDEERIWTVVNDDNHPAAIIIAAQKIDLRGLRAFRVIRPAVDESFGILSCEQHGYLLAFRNGQLSGVRRVDALRDVRLPDPDVASSASAPSVIAKHPTVLFTTEGATVGTDGYLLTYHMYEISRTKTGITFSERWSDVAVDMETRAGFAQTIRFGTLNLAIPPAGDRSFYYVQTDLLAEKVFPKQCVESTNKRIDCKPWDLGRDASPTGLDDPRRQAPETSPLPRSSVPRNILPVGS